MERVLLVIALALAAGAAGVVALLRARGRAARQARLAAALDRRTGLDAENLCGFPVAADGRDGEAAAARQTRADFLAAMSHELRTPLNAVIGFAELLRINEAADPLTRRQSQAVDEILGAGRQLLGLIEGVLDLAGIEAGRLRVVVERVDPQLLVREVCDQLKSRARAGGITVRAPAPAAGMVVMADPSRLRQVLLNLIGNAIAYTDPGGEVLVEIRRRAEGVTVAVHDTGVGIAEDRMAELFEPFNRLGREASAVAGAGIGLAVSRRLAEAMGGRLEAASEQGAGSTFTLHLVPAALQTAPVQASVPLGGLPGATVLYVEDNRSNIALMRQVMAALGPIQLYVAETGRQGLAMARDLRPDVILTDINLPDLSGFELKTRLDADPLTRGLPVLALTAGTCPGDVQRGEAAGFRDYLTKPLDIAALAAALNRALGASETSAATSKVA